MMERKSRGTYIVFFSMLHMKAISHNKKKNDVNLMGEENLCVTLKFRVRVCT